MPKLVEIPEDSLGVVIDHTTTSICDALPYVPHMLVRETIHASSH